MNKLHPCLFCEKVYRTESALMRHWSSNCRMVKRNTILREVPVGQVRIDEVPASQVQADQDNVSLSHQSSSEYRMSNDVSAAEKTLIFRCKSCGLRVPESNYLKHLKAHRGIIEVDEFDVFSGTYFCDLCALTFATQKDLHAHWRIGCFEIFGGLLPVADDSYIPKLRVLIKKLLDEKVQGNDDGSKLKTDRFSWFRNVVFRDVNREGTLVPNHVNLSNILILFS